MISYFAHGINGQLFSSKSNETFFHKTSRFAETRLVSSHNYIQYYNYNQERVLINKTRKPSSEFLLSKCLVALKDSLGLSVCGKEQYFQVWRCSHLSKNACLSNKPVRRCRKDVKLLITVVYSRETV